MTKLYNVVIHADIEADDEREAESIATGMLEATSEVKGIGKIKCKFHSHNVKIKA